MSASLVGSEMCIRDRSINSKDACPKCAVVELVRRLRRPVRPRLEIQHFRNEIALPQEGKPAETAAGEAEGKPVETASEAVGKPVEGASEGKPVERASEDGGKPVETASEAGKRVERASEAGKP
eukprot:15285385-Alexandrium_andersonii.AAC.1